MHRHTSHFISKTQQAHFEFFLLELHSIYHRLIEFKLYFLFLCVCTAPINGFRLWNSTLEATEWKLNKIAFQPIQRENVKRIWICKIQKFINDEKKNENKIIFFFFLSLKLNWSVSVSSIQPDYTDGKWVIVIVKQGAMSNWCLKTILRDPCA